MTSALLPIPSGWSLVDDKLRATYPVFQGERVLLRGDLGISWPLALLVDGLTITQQWVEHEVMADGVLHLDMSGPDGDSVEGYGPGRSAPLRSELVVESGPVLLEDVTLRVRPDDPRWLRSWPTAVASGSGWTITVPAGPNPPRELAWLLTDPELWSNGRVPRDAPSSLDPPRRMSFQGRSGYWWQ
jgi:hypothetical protein